MELKEAAHKKTISEHNIEHARLLSDLEEKEHNINITKKDLDRITRERVRLKLDFLKINNVTSINYIIYHNIIIF